MHAWDDPIDLSTRAGRREILNRTLRTNLPPVALGLSVLYVLLALSHSLLLQPPARTFMVSTALTSALLLVGLWWLLRRVTPPTWLAHPISAGIAGVILFNSLLHMALIPEPKQSTNIALLMVGIGSLFLSLPWFAGIAALTLVGWGAIVWQAPPSADWVHFGFMLGQATLLSLLILLVRLRTHLRMERLHQREQARAGELARALETLRQREDTLRRQALTFAHISDGVVVLDQAGWVIDCNRAAEQLFGHSRAELIGPPAVTPRGVAVLPFAHVVAALAPGAQWSGELPFMRQDGTWGVCEVTVLPIGDDSAWIATLAVCRDITERKRTEQALYRAKDAAEAASRAKSAFLANMSHELRTPLTAIIGYSELLETEVGQNSRLHDDLGKIQNAGQHLLQLINDVLDLSKIEAGKVDLQIGPCDLAQLVEDVATAMRPVVERQHNRLCLAASAANAKIYTDAVKLRQVLINLVSNAAKFTEQGAVTIAVDEHADEQNRRWRLRVSDTGIGIAPEDMHLLFQDFQQINGGIASVRGGTGLGLALSRRLCELLGAAITVESQPGVGSTFTVHLPDAIGPVRL